MKITEPYQGEAADPNSRKRRLETVLSAWRFPRLAYYCGERPTPPTATALTAEELVLWLEILRVAEPLPPRHHVDGLRTYARLHGLHVEDLERDGTLLILGDQVAVQGQLPGLGFLGYHWSLLVPAQVDGEATEAVLRKRFQNLDVHDDEVIAWGSWENCTDSIAPLVRDALSASPDELARLWKLSLALNIEYRFLPALPAAPAKALADLLGKELEAAADGLTLEKDIRLLRFAVGQADAPTALPPLQLPASRFAGLLAVEDFFEHARHRYSDWYYDSVARALARVADAFALGNVLLKLEPGSALIAALDAVWLDHPEFIATYAWHPAFQAEGAFTLLQLQQRNGIGYQANQLELGDEWLQAQRLGRELLLLGDPSKDAASLIALGIHDERKALGRRHHGVAGIDRGKAQYDGTALWADAVSDPARSEHYVVALDKHFRGRVWQPDAALVFALRLLAPLRESGQGALATRLATAIVGAYVAALALDAGALAIPTVLAAYGELLASLSASLDADGEVWRLFLRPFDAVDYLQRALDDQTEQTTSNNSPSFTVPQVLRAHAEVLVALAGAVDAFEDPLAAALALYDADRKAGLHVAAFSWMQLARITSYSARPVGEPLFVAIGRLFARVAGGAPWLDAFLRSESEPHVLAGILAGLGPSHPLAGTIRPKLAARIEALLAEENGVALGHALELANLLRQADMPHESEQLARRALDVVGGLPRGVHDTYTPVARAQLAGALAQQSLWPELLTFEPQGNLIVVSPQSRFIENMRALALMESGKPGDAEGILRRILEAEPTNAVALVNFTALYLRAENWPKVIEASERARPMLSGDDRDRALINEALAREQLQDPYGATNLVASLSESAAKRQDVLDLLQRLRRGGQGAPPVAPEVVAADVPDAPEARDESVDIAIVTALPEEYEAVRERLVDPRLARTGEGRFANFYGWQLGRIRKSDGGSDYTVALATTGRAGNLDAFYAIMQTIERWNPRVVLFSGIAGGLKRDALAQGDIVLAETIWHYDYGKIVNGTYEPRHRDYPTHSGLLNQGRIFGRASVVWRDCGLIPPAHAHIPKCLWGLIGSGDKVIDDLEPAFIQSILKARRELQAVEMEAAGAGAAIQKAQERGFPVAFMMVRAISDMPKEHPDASGAGTQERDEWKKYASALAAQFVVSWVASDAWPFPPRELPDDPEQVSRPPHGKR
jgi:adenosylhomocysteine nucleosidase